MDLQVDIVAVALTSLVGVAVAAMWAQMGRFFKEQRAVNAANAIANRSLQRDVIFRYFRIIVEQGVAVTPAEYEHVKSCYDAYHANGGNGTCTLMMRKIDEHVKLVTGIKED